MKPHEMTAPTSIEMPERRPMMAPAPTMSRLGSKAKTRSWRVAGGSLVHTVDGNNAANQAERDDAGTGNRAPRERGERAERGERGPRSGRGPRNGPRSETAGDAAPSGNLGGDAGNENARPPGEERTGARDEDGGQRRGNGRGSRRGPRRQDGDAFEADDFAEVVPTAELDRVCASFER
jgi:ribonuclease E